MNKKFRYDTINLEQLEAELFAHFDAVDMDVKIFGSAAPFYSFFYGDDVPANADYSEGVFVFLDFLPETHPEICIDPKSNYYCCKFSKDGRFQMLDRDSNTFNVAGSPIRSTQHAIGYINNLSTEDEDLIKESWQLADATFGEYEILPVFDMKRLEKQLHDHFDTIDMEVSIMDDPIDFLVDFHETFSGHWLDDFPDLRCHRGVFIFVDCLKKVFSPVTDCWHESADTSGLYGLFLVTADGILWQHHQASATFQPVQELRSVEGLITLINDINGEEEEIVEESRAKLNMTFGKTPLK